MLAPLINKSHIEDRLNAVQDMMGIQFELDVFRAKLGKLKDWDRLLASVFKYSV